MPDPAPSPLTPEREAEIRHWVRSASSCDPMLVHLLSALDWERARAEKAEAAMLRDLAPEVCVVCGEPMPHKYLRCRVRHAEAR